MFASIQERVRSLALNDSMTALTVQQVATLRQDPAAVSQDKKNGILSKGLLPPRCTLSLTWSLQGTFASSARDSSPPGGLTPPPSNVRINASLQAISLFSSLVYEMGAEAALLSSEFPEFLRRCALFLPIFTFPVV